MYEVPNQQGKLVFVTGANSGTGKEAARKLAGAGADVILAVRTPAKGEQARQEILNQHPGASIDVRRIDLVDQGSVAAFADHPLREGRPVDLLLNNAGVMFPPVRHETVDGFELQMGSNFFGPFALTVRLLPVLLKAEAPRVVTMTSGMAARGEMDFEDLNWTKSYVPIAAYGRSKLADLLLSQELARITGDRGWPLLSVAAHPGNAATNIAASGPNLGGESSLLFRIAWKVTPQHPVREPPCRRHHARQRDPRPNRGFVLFPTVAAATIRTPEGTVLRVMAGQFPREM